MKLVIALLLFFMAATFAHAQGVPAGNKGDMQCNNGAGAFAACGNNINTTPFAQYVSEKGNDANDGLTPQTAKATIYKAIQSLATGSFGSPTPPGQSGNGTIYCVGQCNVGSPVPGGGIWLMGANDPNYASPPPGWLKAYPYSGGALKIVGLAPYSAAPNSKDSTAAIIDCGSQWGPGSPPCVWLSATTGFSMENISFPPYRRGVYAKIGITSTGDRSGVGGVSGVTFRNVQTGYGGGSLGNGPCIDVGSNSFWLTFDYIDCGGGEAAMGGSLSRNGSTGVVTLTTSATNDLYVGESVSVFNASDRSFNGVFTVTGVSGSPQTTATWNQPGANASATVPNGEVWTEKMFVMNIDGGTGAGSGIIQAHHWNTGSGAIRAKCAGDLDVDDIFVDAPYSVSPAAMIELWGPCDGHAGGRFRRLNYADTFNQWPFPAIINWSYVQQNVLAETVSGLGANVWGPAIIIGADGYSSFNSTYTPHTMYQVGFFDGRIWGQEDAARRNFTSTMSRFQNIVLPPSQWSGNGFVGQPGYVATTPGITAPDGSTGAYQAVSTTGSGQFLYLYLVNPGTSVSVGDYYIGGAWMRPAPGNAWTSNPYLQFALDSGDLCTNGTGGSNANAYMLGDGQWMWMTVFCQVATNPNPSILRFGVPVGTTPVQFYAPIFYHITAAQAAAAGFTNSANEFNEWIRNLSPTASTAAPGDVAPTSSQLLGVTSGSMNNPNLTVLNTLASQRRAVAFPDASGNVNLTIASGTLSVTAGNSVGCVDQTATASGATTAMKVAVSPVSPQSNTQWSGFVSAPNTVDIRVCTTNALAGSAVTYNWSVVQ